MLRSPNDIRAISRLILAILTAAHLSTARQKPPRSIYLLRTSIFKCTKVPLLLLRAAYWCGDPSLNENRNDLAWAQDMTSGKDDTPSDPK